MGKTFFFNHLFIRPKKLADVKAFLFTQKAIFSYHTLNIYENNSGNYCHLNRHLRKKHQHLSTKKLGRSLVRPNYQKYGFKQLQFTCTLLERPLLFR